MMKGISPMVAVVLLVAFTVAVGGVISVFFSGLITTQTQQVTNTSGSVVKCASSLTIDSVKLPASGTGVVNVTFTNPGQQNIVNTVVEIIFNNGTAVSTTNGPTTLTPGQGALNTTAGILSGSVSTVRVRGTCAGNQPVSASCDSSKSCWQTG